MDGAELISRERNLKTCTCTCAYEWSRFGIKGNCMCQSKRSTRFASELAGIRTCRICGCTDDYCRGCIVRTGWPCHWIEIDLCSACKPSDTGEDWIDHEEDSISLDEQIAVNAGLCLAWRCENKAESTGYCLGCQEVTKSDK